MFELTLCLDFNRQKYLSEFYKSLLPIIKQESGIIIKHNNAGKSYLSLAVTKEKKELIKAKVLDFVLGVIKDDFKYNFFKEKILINKRNYLTDAFFRSISNFDEDLDRDLILQHIEYSGEIVIESLFYFKLQHLLFRWQKTAEIINQNLIMENSCSMIEILKYLCVMSENNTVLLELKFYDKQIEIKNYVFHKRFKHNADGVSKLFEEIIKLNPIKINIVDNDSFVDCYDIIPTLLNIFKDKIYFI